MRLLPSTLQRRFLVGLLGIVLVMTGFFFAMLNNHIKEIYLSEAHSKANLMVAHTEAIQHYVRSVLRPAVSGMLGMDAFIIEAMSSSYVTRNILSELNVEDKDFIYRRVARNARNPESEVNEFEALFFEKFMGDLEATRLEETDKSQNRPYLVVARPVYFDESCMRCHGDPQYAPAMLIEMYGSERGFWRQQGELAGLDIVSVPLEGTVSGISKSVTIFSICFAAGMLLMLVSVQGFFNRLVVHNLRRVGHILRQQLFKEENNKVLASLRREVDIETMIHSITTVAAHLREARAQLSDYAKNLENMVAERTSDLELAVTQRSADVRLFMRLLSDFNSTQEKPALLQTSLRLIAGHFGANRAAYMCGLSDSAYTEWPNGENANQQKDFEQLQAQLRAGEAAALERVWLIPVQTAGQTRGMLALYWQKEENTKEKAPGPMQDLRKPESANFPLALAFGRQLGIALDNLDALDNLLRQNTLLDSIVEGVNDPLILVESGMRPVLGNSSARSLAADITPEGGICALLEALGVNRIEQRQEGPVPRETILPEGRSFVTGIHPLSSADSNALRAVIHIHETTEEKRILAHARQSEKLAAVGQLAAGLAHEINNPLGVIQCYAELMADTDLDEQRKSDLAVIMRHVEHARRVLRDMLDFSSSRSSCPGMCNIVELLKNTHYIFQSQGRSNHFEIRLELDGKIPDIYVDRRMLEQVIVNLLLNAKDAVTGRDTEGAGVIILGAQHAHETNTVLISVTDNGAGIPAHVLPKIFDPFFTTKGPRSGTGLGLSIAFGMVNDMGGKLEAHSPVYGNETAPGTAFTLSIPVGSLEECYEYNA